SAWKRPCAASTDPVRPGHGRSNRTKFHIRQVNRGVLIRTNGDPEIGREETALDDAPRWKRHPAREAFDPEILDEGAIAPLNTKPGADVLCPRGLSDDSCVL